ncbi:hypothetical protein JWJ90_21450 [Desulfobulbus rhabdoformis]|jgi:hypothetical protein|uniref:hypothetical protein n=1 Tax=Desulfobulbus rhabdoformis TaxID=34032 RepID=UPI00196666CF|nr:hypothetical protein [Desulfobulbus rhabdoformis]MBM9616833.1 hypothetical protein [Desulfobulbus rhabdoformis]
MKNRHIYLIIFLFILFSYEIGLSWHVDLGVFEIKSHHDNPVKSAVENSKEVIHKTGKELERFYKRVDREISKGIHKTGKEIGRAPANIGKFPKKFGKEIKRYLERDYSPETEECGKDGVVCYEVQIRNGLRGEVAAQVGGTGYLRIGGGMTRSLYSKIKNGKVNISILVNPANCGWSPSTSMECWYSIHHAMHKFPTEFAVEWSRKNEITVYWDPKSMIRQIDYHR